VKKIGTTNKSEG